MGMDSAELRRAIEAHGRSVFSIALRITRDYGTAEEVAQDVFLELNRAAEHLEGEDHMRFWLRRVAVHRATDALRKQVRRPEASAEEWMEDQHSRWAEVPGAGGALGLGTRSGSAVGDGAASAVPLGVARRLETMVGSLPEAMRVAVVLRYAEEMTPEEISALLKQPVATVRSNLQRGLKLLRQKAAVTMKEYVREQRA